MKNSWKCCIFCQHWFFGQKFDFSNSVFLVTFWNVRQIEFWWKKKISVEGSLITINYGQALYPVTNFSTIFQCCCKTHFPLLTLCFLEHLRLTYTSLLRNTKAHWSTQKIQFYLTHCGSIPIFVIKFDFVKNSHSSDFWIFTPKICNSRE